MGVGGFGVVRGNDVQRMPFLLAIDTQRVVCITVERISSSQNLGFWLLVSCHARCGYEGQS